MATQGIFRYRSGIGPNLAAFAYTFLGYALGLWLLTRPAWSLNAAGVLLLAHSLVFSALLMHELMHRSIFTSARLNERAGTVLSWLNGSCYAPFQALAHKHIRHHKDRADVISFDSKAFLLRSPAWFRGLVLALEWAYVPAVEFIMHGYVVLLPFTHPGQAHGRARTAAILGVRLLAFGLLAVVSVRALFLYFLAYVLFLSALRFVDAFQHTYEAFAVLEGEGAPDLPRRSREYEQMNTYSNLVSTRFTRLNLLFLNFPYHNAHHARSGVAWHDLPALHREIFGEHGGQIIPMGRLLASYHRHRVRRILSEDYGEASPGRVDGFIGAVGVSLLTAV